MPNQISRNTLLSVIAAGIMSFSGVVIETSMNITFPTLMREFNVNTSTVQWMTTIYLLIVSIVVPLSATLNRNFPTKRLFITANLLFILGVTLDLLAPTFSILLLGRVIQGLGTGIALPLMFNIILEQVPQAKIGVMMGVGNLITAIAPAVGPTFGGIVVSSIGWRYIFAILLPILVCSLILGIFNVKQSHSIERSPLDLGSLLLIIVTFTGLVYGFSNMNNWFAMLPIIIGFIALIALFRRSMQLTHPIIDLSVMQNKAFAGHVAAFFMLQFITLGLSFILPTYIQMVNHQSAFMAGLMVLPGAAMGAVLAPISGNLLDKWGAYKPLAAGMTFGFVGLLLFTIFGTHLSSFMILAFYIIYMFCIGLSFGNIMTSGLSHLKDIQKSDGNAVFNTIQQISGAISTSIIATIVGMGQASHHNLAQGTAIGSEHGLILLLILVIIAAFLLNRVVTKKAK
jgi:MFS transporter, DHA2 family, lincomycin resistance protein